MFPGASLVPRVVRQGLGPRSPAAAVVAVPSGVTGPAGTVPAPRGTSRGSSHSLLEAPEKLPPGAVREPPSPWCMHGSGGLRCV